MGICISTHRRGLLIDDCCFSFSQCMFSPLSLEKKLGEKCFLIGRLTNVLSVFVKQNNRFRADLLIQDSKFRADLLIQ